MLAAARPIIPVSRERCTRMVQLQDPQGIFYEQLKTTIARYHREVHFQQRDPRGGLISRGEWRREGVNDVITKTRHPNTTSNNRQQSVNCCD